MITIIRNEIELKKTTSQEIMISGWIQNIRKQKNILFFNLRIYYKIIQVIIKEKQLLLFFNKNFSLYDLVLIKGLLLKTNKIKLKQDKISNLEIIAQQIQLINQFQSSFFKKKKGLKNLLETENFSLKYRDLYLRNLKQNSILRIKSNFYKNLRNFLYKKEFIEISTPILSKNTEEGSRNFLVKYRLNKNYYFSLSQSPQLFKQALISSGYQRYFQIAKCFRDEDSRADRQPEFEQLDLEIAFITQKKIFKLIEQLLKKSLKELLKNFSFKKIRYQKALKYYTSDSPDIRYKIFSYFEKKKNFLYFRTRIFKKELFLLLLKQIEKNTRTFTILKKIKILKISDLKEKKFFYQYFEIAPEENILKIVFLNQKQQNFNKIKNFIYICRRLIINIIEKNQLLTLDKNTFVWIYNFPMFKLQKKKIVTEHHPFTKPQFNFKNPLTSLTQKQLLKITSSAYDLAFLGKEILSGSLRNNHFQKQIQIFKVLGFTKKNIQEEFQFFIEVLKHSMPPHGGAAIGIDRLLQLVLKQTSLQEVIAFPKTSKSTCLFTNSPNKLKKNSKHEFK